MQLAIELIQDEGLWDGFVEKSPYGLLFHKWDFLKAIERHTKFQLLPYGVYLGEELICLYPIFYRRYQGLKMVFSPPPRSSIPYLGFVLSPVYDTLRQRRKELYINTVVDEMEQEIRKLSPNYVSIDSAPRFVDLRPFKWNGYDVDTHFNYVIGLDKPLDKIWSSFGKDCKERIKEFSRSDVSLKETSDIATYFDLEKKMYEEQGLNAPVVGKEYLQEIYSLYPDNMKVYYLTRNGELADVECAYMFKDKFKLLWCVPTIGKKMYGNQEYSTWELIKKAKQEGYREFEIVGANIKRFCSYQSKFNPTLDMTFTFSKMDTIGTVAEWSYMNIVRRRFTPVKHEASV